MSISLRRLSEICFVDLEANLKFCCSIPLKKSMKTSWVTSVSPRSSTSSGLPRIVPPLQQKNKNYSHEQRIILLHGCAETKQNLSSSENISWVSAAHSWNIFEHKKINFVFPIADYVIFFFQNLSECQTNISDCFPEISKQFSKDYRR